MSEKIATREAYGKALAEFGAKYENLVVLDADLAAMDVHGAFLLLHQTEDGLSGLASAGTDQAGDTQDFVLEDLEGHAVDHGRIDQILDLEQDFVGLAFFITHGNKAQLTADHHVDDIVFCRIFCNNFIVTVILSNKFLLCRIRSAMNSTIFIYNK